MQNKELASGRFAMMAALERCLVQEAVSGGDVEQVLGVSGD